MTPSVILSRDTKRRNASRHRAILPLTVVLALITGATVAATISLATAPIPGPVSAVGIEDSINRFYTAVNTVIRTGDVAALNDVMSADAVVPALAAGHESGRSRFAQQLVNLHISQPGLRLVLHDMVVEGDRVVAWVVFDGWRDEVLASRPSTKTELDSIDNFRLNSGTVVEIWGATVSLGAPKLILDADLAAPAVTEGVVSLSRLNIAPGGSVPQLVGPGSSALIVERGALTVDLARAGRLLRQNAESGNNREEPTVSNLSETIHFGDQLTIPTATPYNLRNEGNVSATVLIAVIEPPPTKPMSPENAGTTEKASAWQVIFGPVFNTRGGDPSDWPSSVELQHLARMTVSLPGSDELSLRVEQLEIAVDAGVPSYRPSNMALAVTASGTTMMFTDSASDATNSQPIGSNEGPNLPAIFHTGQMGELPVGSTITINNIGHESAVLLLLTLAPVTM